MLDSVSRVMHDIVDPEHIDLRAKAFESMATFKDAEDMITIGAYVEGSDARIDYAKRVMPKINAFLKQDMIQKISYQESLNQLRAICQAK